ncbi:MAG: Fe-S cluster assembly protein SufD [Hyphomicrobiaceae bacterium]
MTVQLVRTKAEDALVEQFTGVESRLPGDASTRKLRKAAIGAFAATGLPHRRIEEWKYTDLRNMLKSVPAPAASGAARLDRGAVDAALGPLAAIDAYRLVFVDGVFAEQLSDRERLPAGAHFQALAEALGRDADWLVDLMTDERGRSRPVLDLTTAFMTDGVTLRVSASLDKPILLAFVRAEGEAGAVSVRNFLRFEPGVAATLIEAYVRADGSADEHQTRTASAVHVGAGASVAHVKTAVDGGVHLANLAARLDGEAVYRPFQLTVGGQLARNDIEVVYAGEGGSIDLAGATLLKDRQHCDTTLVVDHAVPQCQSRELFKYVLADEARGIFQGKVIVRPDAQKTDGKQMAQALMLSEAAEFDSKPELEIYADDVVCGHGATVAEIDEEMLFYCQSRGIPAAEARALLTESFVGEAIAKIEDEALRDSLMDMARGWLRG